MAYVNQQKKKELSVGIKAVLVKYGLKGSISVNHHSTLVVTIKSGKIDFASSYEKTTGRTFGEYQNVNTYWCQDQYTGVAKECLEELKLAMKGDKFFDHSDSQSDYFHCSHYIDINIGKYDKPYEATN